MRDEKSLYVILETSGKAAPEVDSRVIYALDIAKLSSRYSETAYSVNITGDQVRLFDANGWEIKSEAESAQVLLRSKRQVVEVAIPLKRFEEDLRSIAVRGLRPVYQVICCEPYFMPCYLHLVKIRAVRCRYI